MMIKLRSKNTPLHIIQVYAPNADKEEEILEEFYEEVNSLQQTTEKREATIILGDFNAKVNRAEVTSCVGKYGLVQRNARGDTLVEFCQNENLWITNTWCKLPRRRLYT